MLHKALKIIWGYTTKSILFPLKLQLRKTAKVSIIIYSILYFYNFFKNSSCVHQMVCTVLLRDWWVDNLSLVLSNIFLFPKQQIESNHLFSVKNQLMLFSFYYNFSVICFKIKVLEVISIKTLFQL